MKAVRLVSVSQPVSAVSQPISQSKVKDRIFQACIIYKQNPNADLCKIEEMNTEGIEKSATVNESISRINYILNDANNNANDNSTVENASVDNPIKQPKLRF